MQPDDVADYDKVYCPKDLSPARPSPTPPPCLDIEESDEVRQVLDVLPAGAGPDAVERCVLSSRVDVIPAERAATSSSRSWASRRRAIAS